MDKMKEQNTEGCRIAGRVKVNKVGERERESDRSHVASLEPVLICL
jgi:hypothetical protein